MNKIKLNTGLASIMIVASLFAGWQALLLVVLLMFLFCEVDEKVKDVAVKVITFYVGYTLFTIAWGIIVSGVNVATGAITSFVTTWNTYVKNPIDYLDASVIVTPISSILGIVDSVVSLLLSVVRLGFILAILTGKNPKGNAISKKIDEYVNSALNYVNGVVVNAQPAYNQAPVQQPVQQANTQRPVQQVAPQQPVVSQQVAPQQPVAPQPQGQQQNQNNNQ